MKGWDIIPDIHGQRTKLEAVLAKLGYRDEHGAYRHPERRALFLGDYIDRGPDVRGVLQIVRAMVEAGEALALMGNHELNAIHFHSTDPRGRPLRPHAEEKLRQHRSTLDQFSGAGDEWAGWLSWFKTLPLFHEEPDFRAVHACWAGDSIRELETAPLMKRSFVQASAREGAAEKRAVDLLLKGPEVDLPRGRIFTDKEGKMRPDMRARWWSLRKKGLTYADIVMPPGAEAPEVLVPEADLESLPDYPRDARPVFVGHYWMTWKGRVDPLADNIVCLDHSAGLGRPLVACRWNGSIKESAFCVADAGGNGDRP